MWGCYHQLNDNHETARECFSVLIQQPNPSPHIYSGYLQHLFKTKQFQEIIKIFPSVKDKLAENVDTHLLYIKSLELASKQQQADSYTLEIYERFKTHAEIVYGTCTAHIRRNNLQKALTILNNYLNEVQEKPLHFLFYFMKAQILFAMRHIDKAQDAIKKALELNPGFEQGWLLSSFLHELRGDIESAINGYQHFLELNSSDQLVQQQLALLLFKSHQAGLYSFKKNFEQALHLYNNKHYEAALEACNNCLAAEKNFEPAHILKIEILCILKQPKEAIAHIHALIQTYPDNETWYRSLFLLFKTGIEQDLIIKTLVAITHKFSANQLPVLYLADFYIKKKDHPQAEHYLLKALNLCNDTNIKAKSVHQLTLMYFHQGRYQDLGLLFEKYTALITLHPALANSAAYYYATKGKNLDRAQSLLANALKQEPDNPHYLDTQAVIWYKQKDFARAHALLDKLAVKTVNDFFIHKHKAKILKAQGLTQEAMQAIKTALNLQAPSHEQASCKKLLSKLKFEKHDTILQTCSSKFPPHG